MHVILLYIIVSLIAAVYPGHLLNKCDIKIYIYIGKGACNGHNFGQI